MQVRAKKQEKKQYKRTEELVFRDNVLARSLFGPRGENITLIEKELGIEIGTRGNHLILQGDDTGVEKAKQLLEELYSLQEAGTPILPNTVEYGLRMIKNDKQASVKDVFLDTINVSFRNKVITPKSRAQKLYVDAIRGHDIVFGIGPAGTGKTYLAMAMAVEALANKEVERIILTRPAVEAGEKLGFLPGDLYEKINPYLRPLYDALYEMMDFDKVQRLIERGTVEVAPLAFMRGRTLNDSFIILDEAQNTTSEQMKMFLTRLGFSSRAVITGDITQIDLPTPGSSGLVEAKKILDGINGISFVFFSEKDVVRHPLVQEVIKAYDKMDKRKTDKE